MRILVLLKQVPDTDEVKLDPENGTDNRGGRDGEDGMVVEREVEDGRETWTVS